MKAEEIMTPKPVSVTPKTAIIDAAKLMLQHHISGLPVIDVNGAVVGIVTEGDLLRRTETGTERHRSPWLAFLVGPGRLAGDYVEAHARKVGEVMTSEVAVVDPSDDLADVVRLMEKRHIKRLPVVDNGKLVGIVSRADLVRELVRRLTREAVSELGSAMPDDAIRDRIRAIIDKEPWGPRFSIDITVTDGVVDLRGTVTDDREREAVTVAAENCTGVKAVHDHLLWVEPTSGFVIGADEVR
jgi:CBS domain-containing protein